MGKQYEVENIVDKKKEDGQTFYLVKWKGYSEKDNTWEPYSSVRSCQKMINQLASNQQQKKTEQAIQINSNEGEESNESSSSKKQSSPSISQSSKKIKKSKQDKSDKQDKISNRESQKESQNVAQSTAGSFESDSAETIIKCQQNEDGTLNFEVKWKARSDGSVPENSLLSNKICRENIPQVLIDYYQQRITFKKRESKQ